jgi:hypothetical protein
VVSGIGGRGVVGAVVMVRRCSGVAVVAPATGADRAGAGILTAAWLAAVLGGVGFMLTGT